MSFSIYYQFPLTISILRRLLQRSSELKAKVGLILP
ncbi:hypothetical protein EPYR_01618 [Erwinia pyrifoliae DSM 12163]|nr:hypothetical protein EPYR_01618 [Erwinia pyrifoliae DSM 12163]